MIRFARLQQFRSYRDGSYEFDPSVNIIVGPNASGKTTLIEALLVGLRGKSYKAHDRELLQTGTTWARVDIGAPDCVRTCKIHLQGDFAVKTFVINDTPYKRLLLRHSLPTVLFEPNNLRLLDGGPELRRTFLDELLVELRPDYSTILQQYKRVIAQRNALLKAHRTPTNEQLFVWNVRASECGGVIVRERHALIRRLNTRMSDVYSSLAGAPTAVALTYDTVLPLEQYETALLRALEQTTHQDIVRGFTGHGPHREDVRIMIAGKVAQTAASRGEVRTFILALKMLEATLKEDVHDQKPILLLDDVFSELDGKRRHALVRFLEPYQAFITTTDADVAIKHFKDSTVIPIAN